jgi:outer membrane protein OmpA-like peptidoglycan-associated protein
LTAPINTVRSDTQGRGEANPKAPNTHADGSDDPQGRQLNRRVEVLIEPVAGNVPMNRQDG